MSRNNPIAKALRSPMLHQRRLPSKREKLERMERSLDDNKRLSEAAKEEE